MYGLDPTPTHSRACSGPMSLNWKKIIDHFKSDPKLFYEEGGWEFLEEPEVLLLCVRGVLMGFDGRCYAGARA